MPAIRATGIADGEAVVLGEIFRYPRCATKCQIDRRRAGDPLRFAEPPLDQAGIKRQAGVNCQIELPLYEIGDLIRHDQVDRYLGITQHVFAYYRSDDTRQRHISIQPQTAARRLLKGLCQVLDLGKFRKNPVTSLIELSPLLGEAHLSRRPVEQANAQLLLKRLDVAGYGCLRQFQLPRCSTKASCVYNLDER